MQRAGGSLRGWWADPRVLTLLLAGALAAAGAALLAVVPAAPLLPAPTGPEGALLLAGLLVAFFVTELGQALVEVRRQAYSFSLAGVPLLLGILYCPPDHVVAARIVAAVAAFAVQRAAPLKFSFNTASYLLDAALSITLAHVFAGAAAGLTLRTAAACYLALALTDALMSGFVLLVIRINQGPISLRDASQVLAPASVFVLLNTAIAVTTATFLGNGPLGVALLVVLVAVTVTGYRGYLVLRRRHHSLELVQEFVALTARTEDESVGEHRDLAQSPLVVLLQHVRAMLRAGRVELDLAGPDGSLTRLVVDDDGARHLPVVARRPAVPDLEEAPALLTVKGGGVAECRWLAERGSDGAVVVPFATSSTRGTLVACDRVGDVGTFTTDDLALLRTLTGHLSVAISNAQLVRRLRHDAGHDVLTGLPNRGLLRDRIAAELDTTGRAQDRQAAVLLLDLSRFKEVNDTLGHHVGDELLRVVAARLLALDLPAATVARLGGDEFAVLLPARPDAEDAAIAAARLVTSALGHPVALPEAVLSTGASIGIALAQPHSGKDDLLRHADTAMYAAKAAGAPFAVYDEDLDRGRVERLSLLADLHQALDADELTLHYQPKFDLAFGVVTSVEALVRWTHPRLGNVPPDVFVPLAESTALIEPLTRAVLGQALAQCRRWMDAGTAVSVAVNLSARNVGDPELPEQVAAALVHAGVPAELLILEITESSVMGDPDHTVPILRRLAAIGVTLSLDDFGTGYSSLSYLQRLPVRELKIDRSFVVGLEATSDDRAAETSAALIRSITGLKTTLGLRIVAEGVEDGHTMERLRELGCDLIQGYHIGRPAPAEELTEHLRHAARSRG